MLFETLDPGLDEGLPHRIDPPLVKRILDLKERRVKEMGVSLQQARKIADEAWLNSLKRDNGLVKRCSQCFEQWWSRGQKEEEKPPDLPSDFDGVCPVCGGKLSEPKVPF